MDLIQILVKLPHMFLYLRPLRLVQTSWWDRNLVAPYLETDCKVLALSFTAALTRALVKGEPAFCAGGGDEGEIVLCENEILQEFSY